MTRRVRHEGRVLALSLAGVLLCASPSLAQSSSPAPSAGSATLTASVHAVDAQARTLDVVTGVGHALRILRFSCADGVEVKTAAGKAPLASLRSGQRVRVEYTKTAAGSAAKAIEVLEWPSAGGAR